MKSEAALPVHAIFETSVMGVSKTLPDLKEIVRSVGAPTKVVNFFQSTFTSVSITPAIVVGLLRAVAAPFQVTATTSITRSSIANAGDKPSAVKPNTAATTTAIKRRPDLNTAVNELTDFIVSILNLPRSIVMSIDCKHLIPSQFGLAKPTRRICPAHHYGGCHGITQPTSSANNRRRSRTNGD